MPNKEMLAILRRKFREQFGEGWDPLRLKYDPERKEWTHPSSEPGQVHYFSEEDLLALYRTETGEHFDGYLAAVEKLEDEDELDT